MKKNIELYKQNILYTLKVSKRAKNLRLTIYADKGFIVTAPKNIEQSFMEKIIVSKGKWILEKIDYFKSLGVLGKTLLSRPRITPKQARENYLKHKETARKLVFERIAHFNRVYGFKVGRISIKNTKTRWGSCSRKGNLNFNYKIALLPPHHADYIIVHELCHLGQFNHSKKFWALVEKTIPNYDIIHRELKKSKLTFI